MKKKQTKPFALLFMFFSTLIDILECLCKQWIRTFECKYRNRYGNWKESSLGPVLNLSPDSLYLSARWHHQLETVLISEYSAENSKVVQCCFYPKGTINAMLIGRCAFQRILKTSSSLEEIISLLLELPIRKR